jgi:hypothetical protein
VDRKFVLRGNGDIADNQNRRLRRIRKKTVSPQEMSLIWHRSVGTLGKFLKILDSKCDLL